MGFNDVVIETPWHNMCAALEKEEPLGFPGTIVEMWFLPRVNRHLMGPLSN